MKSILFIAFLAIATIGCDTPAESTGSDTTTGDTAVSQPSGMGSDTASSVPMDTTTTTPSDTTTTPNPSDTTRTQ